MKDEIKRGKGNNSAESDKLRRYNSGDNRVLLILFILHPSAVIPYQRRDVRN
jgi:hypothetical protein